MSQIYGSARGRAVALAAALTLPAMTLSGCSGLAPTKAEIEIEDQESKYAQAMRMAGQVRAGGDAASAALFYRRAHLTKPDDASAIVGLADTALALGANEDAAAYYRKAIDLAPDTPDLHLSYGLLLLKMNLPKEASQSLERFLSHAPDDHRGYNAVGIAYDLQGRHSEAQATYRKGLQLAPENASLGNNLALSQALSGQRNAAIDSLRALAGRPSGGTRARQNLALILALDGQMDDAAALAARDLTPTQVESNLAAYQAMRTLSSLELAAVVFGIRPVETVSPTTSRPQPAAAAHNNDAASPVVADVESPQGAFVVLDAAEASSILTETDVAALTVSTDEGADTGDTPGNAVPAPMMSFMSSRTAAARPGGDDASPAAASETTETDVGAPHWPLAGLSRRWRKSKAGMASTSDMASTAIPASPLTPIDSIGGVLIDPSM